MKKIISIVLTSVLILAMISIQAVADVPISVVSINPTVEPSWSADYWQVSINFDQQVTSEAALGNVQMSSDTTLKAAVRNNIKIDGVLLEDILTNKGDYSVMVEYNGNSINMFASKGQNIFSATSQQKIEILSGLLDQTKTKTFTPATYYHWTNNTWATTTQPVSVVSISPIVEPSWGPTYWQVSINFDQLVTSAALGNVQMSSDTTLKAAVRNNIKIDGVLLGDILVNRGNDYEIMVEYTGSTINLVAGKGTNIFSATEERKIEILPGLLDQTKTKTFTPATYYHWINNTWASMLQPISVVSISPIVSPSWDADYWQVSINFDLQVTSAALVNVQMSSDTTLKAAVRNNIKIDGVLLGDILASKGDYSVMVEYNGSTINLAASKGQNIFSDTSQQKIEILSGLLDQTKTKTFTPATYYHWTNNTWSTTPQPVDVASITPIIEANWDQNCYTMNINLSQSISSAFLGSVQMSSDAILKASVRNNIKIDNVLLGDICVQKGDYEINLVYNNNTITFVITKLSSLINPDTDHNIEILTGLCDETKIVHFNYAKYYYSAAKKEWALTAYIPVTFANYKNPVSNYITNVATNSKVSDINNSNNIIVAAGSTLVIKDINGNILTDGNATIGTGVAVEVKYGETLYKTYSLVIYGDLDGNGIIGIPDLVSMKQHLLKSQLLTGSKLKAGDIYKTGTGKITINDLLAVKKQLVGIYTISQS